MEMLQVQSAGAASPTLPLSTSLDGTPTAGDSFASTFGRALDDTPDLGPGGPSLSPKVPPREKQTAGNGSDSSSTAGIFFTCFITNLVPPVPAAALNTEGAASGVSLPGTESTADSPPNFSSGLNTSATKAGADMGTFPIAVAAAGRLAASAGKGAIPTASTKSGGRANNPMGGPGATSEQNQPSGTANSMPLGVLPQVAEPLDNSLVGQPADQQAGDELSAMNQLQTSSAWSSQEFASRQKSQASTGFTDSWPQLGDLDPAQVQAALLRPPSQDSKAAYNPTVTAAQTDQAASASEPEASDDSLPSSTTDDLELAELSRVAEDLAGQNLQSSSSITPSGGRVTQDPPEVAGASQSRTSGSTSGDLERAEFSDLLGKLDDSAISVKVSGDKSPQASGPAQLTTKSTPCAEGALSGGLRMNAAGSAQVPLASKSENSVNTLAWVALHAAPVSGSAATEGASAQTPITSSASPVPSQQLDANSQPGNPATVMQKDAASDALGIQPSSAVAANSSEGGANASLADASAGGRGKSGQQSGQTSDNNPANIITIAPNTAATPAADPTTSLLTAHSPSVPVTHTDTTTPPAMPSSNEPPTTLSAWQNYDGGPGKIVRSASVSDSAGGAEMHVELRTGALGPLELHTVVHEGSVGAEIHVQGQEAHTLLAAGLPSLERALGERNLRVENISVYHDQTGGGASGGGKQDSHSGSSPLPQRQTLPWDNPPQRANSANGALEDEESANPASGLSVRA